MGTFLEWDAMNRRQIIALVGISACIPTGIYAWKRNSDSSPTLPDGVSISTLYLQGDTFHNKRIDVNFGSEYNTLIMESEVAESELVRKENITQFVNDIDFNKSNLFIVQNAMQSEPGLKLTSIERGGDGFHFEITVDHPPWKGVNDDLEIHSLLIRLNDESGGTMNISSVNIEGYI